MIRRFGRALLSVVLMAGFGVGAVGAAESGGAVVTPSERRTYTEEVDGAEFRVEMPEHWNGTLLLYSHGYYPEVWKPDKVALTSSEEAEKWLLDKGYALAASNYKGVTGYTVEDAVKDQIALHDWFLKEVGRPSRTVGTGQSMGGIVATLLGERYPQRFDGVLTMCAEYDGQGTWNTTLDMTYAIRTLLVPEVDRDIDLVRPRDPARATTVLRDAIVEALKTEKGRARLALAGALGNVPGWYSAHEARPDTVEKQVAAQAMWLRYAYVEGVGPLGRVDLERRAGGNPSYNIGIDYRRQLARSAQGELVRAAYAEAELSDADLAVDLSVLNAGPRIAPDPNAVAYMYRHAVVRGTNPRPVVTLHNPQDGGAASDQERWYADQIARSGSPERLRQLYVDRGSHCAFSAADEVAALNVLEERISKGRWPSLDPERLNAVVEGFEPEYRQVLDLGSFQKKVMPAAFTEFEPAPFLRSSR